MSKLMMQKKGRQAPSFQVVTGVACVKWKTAIYLFSTFSLPSLKCPFYYYRS